MLALRIKLPNRVVCLKKKGNFLLLRRIRTRIWLFSTENVRRYRKISGNIILYLYVLDCRVLEAFT